MGLIAAGKGRRNRAVIPHPARVRFARARGWKRAVLTGVVAISALALTALAVVLVLFWQDVRAARGRLAAIPTSIYRSKYGDIQYRVVGTGPAVLISHGITGGVDQAEYLVTRFRNLDERYRFVYLSRFGYLKSSPPQNATPRLQAAAYKELLDHLGIERVMVVGNSAGAPRRCGSRSTIPSGPTV